MYLFDLILLGNKNEYRLVMLMICDHKDYMNHSMGFDVQCYVDDCIVILVKTGNHSNAILYLPNYEQGTYRIVSCARVDVR